MVDPRHAALEEAADLERVLALPLDAQVERLEPLSTTQALNGERFGPVWRWNASSLLTIKSLVPQTAPASTRPCPSISLVAE
jgi:hypothetical protein